MFSAVNGDAAGSADTMGQAGQIDKGRQVVSINIGWFLCRRSRRFFFFTSACAVARGAGWLPTRGF